MFYLLQGFSDFGLVGENAMLNLIKIKILLVNLNIQNTINSLLLYEDLSVLL